MAQWRDTTFPIAGIQFSAPTTGATITIDDSTIKALILKPAAGLAALTINMPATPVDGQDLTISSTQAVTTVTHSGNGKTLNGALTTLAANGFGRYKYRETDTSWYRIG